MNTFDKEDRLRRLMGGFSEEETPQPQISKLAAVFVFLLRLAVATAAVSLVDVGLDGNYDLSLWDMASLGVAGLLTIALLVSAIVAANQMSR